MGTNLNTGMKDVIPIVRPKVAELLSQYEVASDARHGFSHGQYHFESALKDTLCKYTTYDMYPSAVYFDTETQTKLNNQLVLISDYSQTESAKFITGARSLGELDDYFDEIERLGALEYVEAYANYYSSTK